MAEVPWTWNIEKDDYDEVDKTFEFGPNPENRGWLRTAETVVSGTIGPSVPAGLTISGVTPGTTSISGRFIGGTKGTEYLVPVKITTSTGQKVNKTARVYVRDL